MNCVVRILIVEDEFMISEDIALRLSDYGYVIEGIADSADKALQILEKGKTDLALLDININGDIDGVDLAVIIKEKYNIPIIFLTSFANKAVVERANKANPSAYLLKPFNDRQVQITIDMALHNFSNKVNSAKSSERMEFDLDSPVLSFDDGLFLKKDTHFEKVEYRHILYLEAESNYTTVYTDNDKYVFSYSLRIFEGKLPASLFIRVHRSYIVNVKAITGFEGNYLFIGNSTVSVSKNYREELFKRINVF